MIFTLSVFLVVSDAVSQSRSSSTLLKVEYISETAAEEHKNKLLFGSADVHSSADAPKVPPKLNGPPEPDVPAESAAETVSVALDTFVCRYVPPVVQCYSPSRRQCVVLKNRSSKPSVVNVVPCIRNVLDVCFMFEKYCEY